MATAPTPALSVKSFLLVRTAATFFVIGILALVGGLVGLFTTWFSLLSARNALIGAAVCLLVAAGLYRKASRRSAV
jgi:hypothetical protein